jgi:peptidoglycan/LPS O-acetylase OafA/YrhL
MENKGVSIEPSEGSTEKLETSISPSQKTATTHRPELDGLRCIAVLAVIFFHAGFALFKGGFVGVDVFFVISGYLMTSIILKESSNGQFTLAQFYERRARRILPMLFATLIGCLFPAYWYMTDTDLAFFVKSVAYSSVGTSNFLFAKTTFGYYDIDTSLIPLVHTWTLAVEEQFYVIIPLIFICLWRFGRTTVLVTICT